MNGEEKNFVVVIIFVDFKLNLKFVVKVVKVKKVEMVKLEIVEKIIGYVVGGISFFG